MALLCISYFIAVGACLSAVGVLFEHALPATAPRRWLWCVIIVASVFLPPALAVWHTSHIIAIWGFELYRLPASSHSMANDSLSHNLLDCSALYGTWFNWMWLISLASLLAWGIANSRRVSRLAQPGDTSRNTIVDGIPVILTDSIGPATVGAWRSKVVLPQWVLALPGADRQYVVRHEEEHRAAHDTWLLCAFAILVSLFPWNLPLWWQLNRLRLAVELDCDNRVVSALGNAGAYGELLFKVAEASTRGPRLQPAFLGASGSLETRLKALLAPARRRNMERALAPVVAIAILAVMLSLPHPQRPGALEGHSMKDHSGSQTTRN